MTETERLAEREGHRRFDREVAGTLFGWTTFATEVEQESPSMPSYPVLYGIDPEDPDGLPDEVPHYETDAAADLEVLRLIRTTWDVDAQYRFARQLVTVTWGGRDGSIPALKYEPGDYSRAALAAIRAASTEIPRKEATNG